MKKSVDSTPGNKSNQSAAKQWTPPSRSDVLKTIRNSGYPLELSVALEAERNGFSSIPTWTWLDRESGQVREVDVVGERWMVSDTNDVNVQLHVLIECKAFRAGIVLFEFGSPDNEYYDLALLDVGDSHVWGMPTTIWTTRESGLKSGSPLASDIGWGRQVWAPASSICSQLGVIQGDPASKKPWEFKQTPAFEQVDTLIRSFTPYQERIGVAIDATQAFISMGALLLVVEGPIRAYRPKRGERRATLRRVKWATVIRRMPKTGGTSVARVDVVHHRHLSEYLRAFVADGHTVAQKLGANRDKILDSVAMEQSQRLQKARNEAVAATKFRS